MTHKAPGKSHRHGITLPELMRMFPDDATAEKWFSEQRWGGFLRRYVPGTPPASLPGGE